jgi:hypothetical protein
LNLFPQNSVDLSDFSQKPRTNSCRWTNFCEVPLKQFIPCLMSNYLYTRSTFRHSKPHRFLRQSLQLSPLCAADSPPMSLCPVSTASGTNVSPGPRPRGIRIPFPADSVRLSSRRPLAVAARPLHHHPLNLGLCRQVVARRTCTYPYRITSTSISPPFRDPTDSHVPGDRRQLTFSP